MILKNASLVFAISFFALGDARAQEDFWQQVGVLGVRSICTLAAGPGERLFAATEFSGVFRSTDGGITWMAINSGLSDLNMTALTVTPTGTLLAGVRSFGLYRSTNFGDSWQLMTVLNGYAVGIAGDKSGTVYAGTQWTKVYESGNDGLSWTEVNSSAIQLGSLESLMLSTQGIVYVGGSGIAWSSNAGQTWSSAGTSPMRVRSLVQSVGSPIYAGSAFEGVFRSTTSLWPGVPSSNGLPSLKITRLAVDDRARVFAATEDAGVANSVYGGGLWALVNSGLVGDSITALVLDDSSYLYAGSIEGFIFRSISPTLVLMPPLLVSPPDDSTDIGTTTVLTWGLSIDASSYHLQVSSDSTFVSLMMVDDSLLTGTSYSLQNLDTVTAYFWRVAARNPSGPSLFSLPYRFVTGPPGHPPQLVYPDDGATNLPRAFTARWRRVEGATSYFFYMKYALIDFGVYTISTVDTSFDVSYLSHGTAYEWKVNSTNLAGTGEFSTPRRFTVVIAPPDPPELLYPPFGVADQPTTIEFRWRMSPTAERYRLTISADGTTSFEDSSIVDTFKVVSGLSHSTAYSWRVNGLNAGGTGISHYSEFATIFAPPPVPALLFPADRSLDQAKQGILVWEKSSATDSYYVQVGTDSSFTTGLIVVDSVVGLQYYYQLLLSPGREYFWRVMAVNKAGSQGWSAPRSFVTVRGLNLDRIPFLSTSAYGVSENYPNPVRVSTSFQVGLPEEAEFDLRVYNITGQEVGTIIKEKVQSGVYAVTWDAGGLPSGVYFYRFLSGTNHIVKKLIKVK